MRSQLRAAGLAFKSPEKAQHWQKAVDNIAWLKRHGLAGEDAVKSVRKMITWLMRADLAAISTPEPSPLLDHGKPDTYRKGNCRCAACSEAWRVYSREVKERREVKKARKAVCALCSNPSPVSPCDECREHRENDAAWAADMQRGAS